MGEDVFCRTAIGRYPLEAVEIIGKIAISTEQEEKAVCWLVIAGMVEKDERLI